MYIMTYVINIDDNNYNDDDFYQEYNNVVHNQVFVLSPSYNIILLSPINILS